MKNVMKDFLNIEHHPGWTGAFSRHQAPEAQFKNGERVMKVNGEADDATPMGTHGTVLGSVHVNMIGMGTAYWVEWDTKPKCARFVIGWKLGAVS